MKIFIAKNPKQLDLCLRLLYAERIPFTVGIIETNKKKIVYEVMTSISDEKSKELQEKYRILIS